jgi:lipopolysaccharide transport protein LptA
MRLRRALLGFVVLAGFLVLALGVTGVLSPKKPEPVAAKTGKEAGGPRLNTINNFEIRGDTWLLKADEARPKEGGGYELVKPSLEVKRTGAAGEEHLTVHASEGTLQMEPAKRVQMSGGVQIEFSGEEKVTLTAPSLEVEPDQDAGRTADEVEMVVEAKEGRQRLWGKGAEFSSKQRLIVVSENVRMELSGAGSGIFPQAAGPPSGTAETPVTKIECRGPVAADGFKRTVDLRGEVRIRQGENALSADRVEVQFAEKSRAPEHFVAEGAVTFKASGADGACDRLVRSAAEDELLLDGKPARVRRGANEIEASRIELSGQKGVIVVPVPGNLGLAGEEAARPAEAITVKWSRLLRLDPDEHRALFLGDVRFARGNQTIECQTLSVKLDPENRRILECKADTDVRLTARVQGGAGAETVTARAEELAYDPQVNSFVLSGGAVLQQGQRTMQAKELAYDPQMNSLVLSGGAVLQQGQRTIRGERIEIHPAEAEIAVAGAGALEDQGEKDSEGFSITWEREMRFSRAKESAVFEGGVGLKDAGDALRAESVTARLSENALKGFEAKGGVDLAEKSGRTLKADSLSAEIGADRKLQRLDASGHVIVEDEGRVARGDRLRWDAQRDSGTLFGSPVELRMGQSRVFGDRLEFAPEHGAITVISNRRVEATVVGGAQATTSLAP